MLMTVNTYRELLKSAETWKEYNRYRKRFDKTD